MVDGGNSVDVERIGCDSVEESSLVRRIQTRINLNRLGTYNRGTTASFQIFILSSVGSLGNSVNSVRVAPVVDGLAIDVG